MKKYVENMISLNKMEDYDSDDYDDELKDDYYDSDDYDYDCNSDKNSSAYLLKTRATKL